MIKIKTNEWGNIDIEKEVIETIAGLATVDCYGLVGMVPIDWQSGITSILGLESIRKGVLVRSGEEGLIIDVHVIVGYGIKISEVASNVIQKVAYVVQNNTGLKVVAVNVNVKGIKVLTGK
ncbi:MAG: Asp23/Gls24 family envelope stress response protein [Syntrophomonas sp.]|uniref:Asp23/Gls24 family envelope stress response protein n=1 Tax=Syntrophomonas sp. TaxID=2053627 RepID=UPI00260F4C93|nr:Asp23/Gls24 family envelope stress response protein [Syntrophomonas sp.]MDD2510132.1 Asp23/Gls24 family envelope stress response protein [Syntrophomonas sp.]MDD3878535.1 Asp23/Gls24 family envelope stress response protein [Syntrophomonas sp.]MDD4626446.1 Asp23/Gls24 family envelope stress response protein [Syntrophomonas sp.]